MQSNVNLPDDLISVGHITGAFGVQGWVRIHPYSQEAGALLHVKKWWLGKSDMRSDVVTGLHDVERLEAKRHGDDIVVRIMGIVGRDAAEALKGNVVQIQRSHFPVLAENEFYWLDLIGLSVENLQGESLGVVAGLIDNGAHPILRVTQLQSQKEQKEQDKLPPRECLIPFVNHFVPVVDDKNKKIIVDWGLDY